ncbi:hypothetical protein [Oharaeibacter diazotrophicus]|uniref:Uncharacterized protein n=1 Tax=Oharaeibacter diazotrophicus TaxID=1920512 RepID=A0A4R6R9P6_9HYPH|nr:hypothetical protein [Oharaeibacter diazotrophicus]TDP82346.1 hypothetical protein EDD54_3613 [Oharaeibacter diazotrophicus]BBE72891.1 hypothetical protein OHA_1_02490 [Pleomorphomonas sp. SM30]GLS76929.1 hypothetical protein GCM10007904_22660 [Oharaeibacter diazotrophicus]
MAVDPVDVLARALGVFYAVGGVVTLRAVAMDLTLDGMLAVLEHRRRTTRNRVRTLFLTVGSLVTVLAGVALAAGSGLSPWLFLAGAAGQGGWLAFARAAFPPADADEAKGRRRSTNAFVGWLAATVFVVWLWRGGRLAPIDAPLPAAALAVAALALAVAGRVLFRRPKADTARIDLDDLVAATDDTPPERVRLAPELGCWPLWDHDSDRNLDPIRLGLPEPLLRRIERFDRAFQDAAGHLDPSVPLFPSEREARAFDAEARAIVAELAGVFGAGNAVWPKLKWALPAEADGESPLRVL